MAVENRPEKKIKEGLEPNDVGSAVDPAIHALSEIVRPASEEMRGRREVMGDVAWNGRVERVLPKRRCRGKNRD